VWRNIPLSKVFSFSVSIEIGVILPTSTPDPARPILGDVRESARFADEAGLDSVWSTDHVIASAPILDSTVVLATAAAVTGRVKIGFGVMLLALRPVAWAAKQISTLQYVSGERVLLGVGTGNPAHGDTGWRAVGASYADRGRRTDDALAVLPDLIAGRPVSLDGGPPVAIAPGATMPPLLIAGEARPALRRAAIFGDGWLAIGLSPEAVATRLGELRRLTNELGRSALTATVVGPQLDTEPRRAAEQLSAYEAAGTRQVILAPTGTGWRADYEFAAAVRAAYPRR
jgi:alkanesulfonate monooxygenase SsuD/methylene tetrahydromethanopterin reductase-like flavin-dependent oxidoreductase (luciferase family)